MNSTVKLLNQASEKYGEKIPYEDEWESISFVELKEKAMIVGTRLLNETNASTTILPVIVYMPKSVKCIVSYMEKFPLNYEYGAVEFTKEIDKWLKQE